MLETREKTDLVPSINECLALMDEHKMLDHIKAHSFKVARVAETLILKMDQSKIGKSLPNLQLVLAGALLHDIAKTHCLNNKCNHARLGGDICIELGYTDIGEIVREHVMLCDFSPNRYQQGKFMAKEIVYYSDKRVMHDTIVSLDERLDYIIEYYGNNSEKRHRLIRKNFQLCRDIEEHLFSFINFAPDDLDQYVSSKPFTQTDYPKEIL